MDYGALDAKHYAQGTNRYALDTKGEALDVNRYALDTKGEAPCAKEFG